MGNLAWFEEKRNGVSREFSRLYSSKIGGYSRGFGSQRGNNLSGIGDINFMHSRGFGSTPGAGGRSVSHGFGYCGHDGSGISSRVAT